MLPLHRDASPADLLPASAAEFPGLIPGSGSSLTLSCRQLRCEEARPSTPASWSWRRGGCEPLGAGWLRELGLILFPHACRRGRGIFQLGGAAPHPAWCPQLSCSLGVAPLSQPGPGCTASLRALGKRRCCRPGLGGRGRAELRAGAAGWRWGSAGLFPAPRPGWLV